MLTAFTIFHTALSLIALIAGCVVIAGLLGRSIDAWWTPAFLWTAVLTSVTGFLFPFGGVTPAFIVGIIALVVLALTLWARRGTGAAQRWIAAAGLVISTYLLAFVTVVQSFLKVPALIALAPTASEPPFAITQGVVLIVFVGLGFFATRASRGALRTRPA